MNSCEDCRYFDSSANKHEDWGACKRYVPRPFSDDDGDERHAGWTWPHLEKTDGCGEWDDNE